MTLIGPLVATHHLMDYQMTGEAILNLLALLMKFLFPKLVGLFTVLNVYIVYISERELRKMSIVAKITNNYCQYDQNNHRIMVSVIFPISNVQRSLEATV